MALKIDRIDTLEMKEKWGTIVACRRKALVTGLNGETDWEILYSALDEAGLPVYGDYLDNDRGSHVALTDRDVTIIDKDKAEVVLTYGMFNDRGQNLFYDFGVVQDRAIAGKMMASVVQRRTNLFKQNGVGSEQLITVQHTYPEADPDFGGTTQTQTGEVDVQLPQKTFTIEGVKQVLQPWDMADNLVGAINSNTWLGHPGGQWMCTEVTWDYRDEGVYFMTFTFQHDPDSWNPYVVFQDERTGRPPEDVVAGVGYKQIPYHRAVNFVQALGFYVIGGAQSTI